MAINKESLVTAGHLRRCAAAAAEGRRAGSDEQRAFRDFPMPAGGEKRFEKDHTLASGGPFRTFSREALAAVTPAMALQHPTWSMGAKVTVDSSTMMNKGLEVIEAHWLFGIDYDRIDVLIQPQSLIHSLVAYGDGSFLAHMGRADMRIPIQFALTYPERRPNPLPPLDFAAVGKIEFFAPDKEKFPLLRLAYEAGRSGQTLPAVLNAANEILVYMFLENRIKYTDISKYVEKALSAHDPVAHPDLGAVLAAQEWAGAYLNEVLLCS